MADRRDEDDFERPNTLQWGLFEEACEKLFYNWDIVEHALDDEWAGGVTEEYCDRVLDYLLANFAERWLEGKGVKMHSVADFITETIHDHFEVEIPHAVALPLAKVMVTLFDECRSENFTGVTHVLGADKVHALLAPKVTPEPSTESQAKSPDIKDGVIAKGNAAKQDDTPIEDNTTPSEQTSEAMVIEDDGWTTVAKKGGKKKGKKME